MEPCGTREQIKSSLPIYQGNKPLKLNSKDNRLRKPKDNNLRKLNKVKPNK